jgi:hypothetical protein
MSRTEKMYTTTTTTEFDAILYVIIEAPAGASE